MAAPSGLFLKQKPGGHSYSKVDMMLHTRKHIKRVVFFFPTGDVRAYIEKGVKNSKIWKKWYVFQPLKL